MRIEEMVRQAVGGNSYVVPNSVRKARQSGGGNSDQRSSQQGATSVGGVNAGTFVDPSVGKKAAVDAADFSAKAKAASAASKSSAPAKSTPSEVTTTPVTSDDGSQVLATLVDQYTRQRAVLAYSMPLRNGGTFSIQLEIESSSQVTQLIAGGQRIDVNA
jgi:hypothetical protein